MILRHSLVPDGAAGIVHRSKTPPSCPHGVGWTAQASSLQGTGKLACMHPFAVAIAMEVALRGDITGYEEKASAQPQPRLLLLTQKTSAARANNQR